MAGGVHRGACVGRGGMHGRGACVKGLTNRLKFLKFWPIRVKQLISCYFYYFVYFPCISDRNWFIY